MLALLADKLDASLGNFGAPLRVGGAHVESGLADLAGYVGGRADNAFGRIASSRSGDFELGDEVSEPKLTVQASENKICIRFKTCMVVVAGVQEAYLG